MLELFVNHLGAAGRFPADGRDSTNDGKRFLESQTNSSYLILGFQRILIGKIIDGFLRSQNILWEPEIQIQLFSCMENS
jgi:hypothetical protein